MKPLSQPKPSMSNECVTTSNRQGRTQLRSEADAILRDLAFVLKMAQEVRDEIDAEKESETFAMA
ncbi:MAG: hypothetical protein EXS16_13775 [Gemmataceae bacterium]|nr:hypothetical protein [Gemmataceae bacterium]